MMELTDIIVTWASTNINIKQNMNINKTQIKNIKTAAAMLKIK